MSTEKMRVSLEGSSVANCGGSDLGERKVGDGKRLVILGLICYRFHHQNGMVWRWVDLGIEVCVDWDIVSSKSVNIEKSMKLEVG
uniref:Uncharacterized protein n=1 Tax=Lactuca sativa TaxID=4236 RepID=A0A9R1W1N4_LACSA|nr:hypothetical protein LSAT_V11C300134710 [Lactuca sativa]